MGEVRYNAENTESDGEEMKRDTFQCVRGIAIADGCVIEGKSIE